MDDAKSARQETIDWLLEITQTYRALRGKGPPPEGVEPCECCGKPLTAELSGPFVQMIKHEESLLLKRLELQENEANRSMAAEVRRLRRALKLAEHDRDLARERVTELERELRLQAEGA